MAFVNQSKRETQIHDNSQSKVSLSPDVGPGAYDIENLKHKELVSALYPRKHAPFNATEAR